MINFPLINSSGFYAMAPSACEGTVKSVKREETGGRGTETKMQSIEEMHGTKGSEKKFGPKAKTINLFEVYC